MTDEKDINEEEVKQFEPEHIYLQWLKLRKPPPVRFGNWYTGLVWLFGIPTLGLIPLMAFLLDLLIFIPKCVDDDFSDPTGRNILNTPISSTEIVRDIRTWGIELAFIHSAPYLFVLIIMGLGMVTPMMGSANQNTPILLNIIFLPFLMLLIFLSLLETGIILAALSRWFDRIALAILTGALLTTIFIIWSDWDVILSSDFDYIFFFWKFCIILLIIIWFIISRRISSSLLDKRRQGGYE